MTSQRTRDRLITRLQQQGIHNELVLDVMRRVPRHIFVDEALAHRAYEDTALPIGYGQTISQPYIVAHMTQQLMQHGMPNSVLEIGTGCGYQTAVLASIFPQVYSVERIEALHLQAKKRLSELEYYNVQLRYTDGTGATVRNKFPAVHAWLAASYAQLGKESEAREAARRFEGAAFSSMDQAGASRPASWVEFLTPRMPYRKETDLEHVLGGMRKAGLK